MTTDAQRQALATLAEVGANVVVVPADIADGTAVKALIDHCITLAPLRGIVHAAGVLVDRHPDRPNPCPLGQCHATQGGWRLASTYADLGSGSGLLCLLLLSGGAVGVGRTALMSAANAFMDTLMQQRRQQGLPGLSMNWGPWADTGMAAGLQTKMAAQGLTLISAQQGANSSNI